MGTDKGSPKHISRHLTQDKGFNWIHDVNFDLSQIKDPVNDTSTVNLRQFLS